MEGGRRAVDRGRGAVDGGREMMDGGRWTVDGGRWAVGGGRWTVAVGDGRLTAQCPSAAVAWHCDGHCASPLHSRHDRRGGPLQCCTATQCTVQPPSPVHVAASQLHPPDGTGTRNRTRPARPAWPSDNKFGRAPNGTDVLVRLHGKNHRKRTPHTRVVKPGASEDVEIRLFV